MQKWLDRNGEFLKVKNKSDIRITMMKKFWENFSWEIRPFILDSDALSWNEKKKIVRLTCPISTPILIIIHLIS